MLGGDILINLDTIEIIGAPSPWEQQLAAVEVIDIRSEAFSSERASVFRSE